MKICLLGEPLLRFSTIEGISIKDSTKFNLNVGGTELNIAVNIANLNKECEVDYYTTLPDNDLKNIIENYCLKNRVNLISKKKQDERMGIYFFEPKLGNKIGKIVFDRKQSSFSNSEISDYDVKESEYKIFHTSGVALATKPKNILQVINYFMEKTKSEIKSFDFNYRSTMWTTEEAFECYKKFIDNSEINIIFANSWDIAGILNKNQKEIDINDTVIFEKLSKELTQKYKTIKYIICTKRNYIKNTEGFNYQAMYFNGSVVRQTQERFVSTIIDRIGSGDAFVGGVLSKLMDNSLLENAVEYGLCCSWLKHSIPGDALLMSDIEMQEYLNFDKTKIVKR